MMSTTGAQRANRQGHGASGESIGIPSPIIAGKHLQ
jgi:hypothetical protein